MFSYQGTVQSHSQTLGMEHGLDEGLGMRLGTVIFKLLTNLSSWLGHLYL